MRRYLAISLCVSLFLLGCPEDPEPEPGLNPLDLTGLVSVTENYGGGALLSMWHSGPNDVWIVGGKPGRSEVLQFDGSTWTLHDPGTEQQLWWVYGFADSGHVFVVGAGGIASRYDGTKWDVLDTGHPNTVFYGVWGSSPTDVWAVSGIWHAAPEGTEVEGDVLLHFDGTQWEQTQLDMLNTPERTAKDLFKVWGAGPDAVFVVGGHGVALHYDGTSWTQKETGTDSTLFTVAGRSATDVYAFGGYGTTELIHWDGTTWSGMQVPEYAPPQTPGLWTAPGESLYIAGLSGYTARLNPDGSWHEGEIVSVKGYHAIRGDGGGAVWAVGGDITSLNPATGAIAISGRTIPRP